MGYSTDFVGRFTTDRPFTDEQFSVLKKLAEDRHGEDTEPDAPFPGFYCQWEPTRDRCGLEWDGGEKFYFYVEWLEFIVAHFLRPWGIRLDGAVSFQGEEPGDRGKIVCIDGAVTQTYDDHDVSRP